MHPLGSALTPDGQYLVISCDDERSISGGKSILASPSASGGSTHLLGGYSETVLRTSDMTVAAQAGVGALFVGLQIVPSGSGYTIYASGGGDQDVKVLTFTPPTGTRAGTLTAGTPIKIAPITPSGSVTNFSTSAGVLPRAISRRKRRGTAGALSLPPKSRSPQAPRFPPTASFCMSPATATTAWQSLRRPPVRSSSKSRSAFSPYGVSVSRDGTKVLVSNWGVEAYSFLAPPTYGSSGSITALASVAPGQDTSRLFFVPVTSRTGGNPKTSSVSVVSVPGANGANASVVGAVYEGQPNGPDDRMLVGETHPSATVIVRQGTQEVEYVTKSNSDALGLILIAKNRRLPDFNLSPLLNVAGGHQVHGSYPNALAVSPDNTRLYVAEAGLDSVAVLDVSMPTAPKLLGRIPTGWYPSALSVSADGKTLYIVNDKGVAEDLNPKTDFDGQPQMLPALSPSRTQTRCSARCRKSIWRRSRWTTRRL